MTRANRKPFGERLIASMEDGLQGLIKMNPPPRIPVRLLADKPTLTAIRNEPRVQLSNPSGFIDGIPLEESDMVPNRFVLVVYADGSYELIDCRANKHGDNGAEA